MLRDLLVVALLWIAAVLYSILSVPYILIRNTYGNFLQWLGNMLLEMTERVQHGQNKRKVNGKRT
jgi:hypothetical protein